MLRLVLLIIINYVVLMNACLAEDLQPNIDLDFQSTTQQIKKDTSCQINYNSSKSAAIVTGCQSLSLDLYVNYKKRKIRTIYSSQADVKWFGNDVATLTSSCGTGCAKSRIFIAPITVIQCPFHDYRFEKTNVDEAPDYANNAPLLVDAQKKIYVCYDDAGNIQLYPFPKYAAIEPPLGAHPISATIANSNLVITYQKGKESKTTTVMRVSK